MSDERNKGHWWHANWTLCAILCLLLALYVAGYFVLAEREMHSGIPISNIRIYRSRAIAKAYAPLAWIEAKLGGQVHLKTPYGDWDTFDP
jgi:hypothetical protein